MSKQAVILAGGFGTRLSHIVKDVPKPMAPINDKPFLDYQLNVLKENGFNEFILLTGYKSEIIEKYYAKRNDIMCIKENTPLGTGGAVINAYPYLRDTFFVINGDTFFDIDFSLLENFGYDKPATLSLRYSTDISRYGLVDIDDDFRIQKFIEKGCLPKDTIDGYINGGIYYIKKKTLTEEANNFKNNNISMETDIFRKLSNNGMLYGLPVGGAFIDIGIPKDYYKAQTYIPETLKQSKSRVIFVDKDGTLIEDTGYAHGKDIKLIYSVMDTLKDYKKSGYKIIIVTNQAGIGKAKFSISDMHDNVNAIKTAYKQNGIDFDGFEYCPYHEDAVISEYKYKSKARKPEAGMLLQACEKTRIDLKNSLMLGDKPDIDNIKLPYLKVKILGR